MKELHFPDCPRQRQPELTDPSASLFKQGLGTYRKAFRDKHTPLLITPLFIFEPPAAIVKYTQTEHRVELCLQ